MSDFVLDTHACVFALWLRTNWAPQREGACVKSKPGAQRPGSPRQSPAEIVLLRELVRIGIGFAELKTAMEKAPSLRFLPLDLAQVNEFAAHSVCETLLTD